MSLYVTFEPHSWYRGFAIKDKRGLLSGMDEYNGYHWSGYTDRSVRTYAIQELSANSLKELKQKITQFRLSEAKKVHEMYADLEKKSRL